MTLETSEKIRVLKSKKQKLKHLVGEKSMENKANTAEIRRANMDITRLTIQIMDLADDRRQVTDHAVLRYLERVKGIDIEGIRREILACDKKGLIGEFTPGEAKIPIGNGIRLVISDGKVVTVLKESEGNS